MQNMTDLLQINYCANILGIFYLELRLGFTKLNGWASVVVVTKVVGCRARIKNGWIGKCGKARIGRNKGDGWLGKHEDTRFCQFEHLCT